MFAVMRTAAAGTWHRCRIDKIQIDWIELAVLWNVYIVCIANLVPMVNGYIHIAPL